jgi:membrane-associated protease RseP (regulator of RpoE activity)
MAGLRGAGRMLAVGTAGAGIAVAALVPAAASAATGSTTIRLYSVASVAGYYQADGQPTPSGQAPDVGGYFYIVGSVYQGTHARHIKHATGTSDIVCTFTAATSGFCDGSITIGGSELSAQHVPDTFVAGGVGPLELITGTGRFATDSGTATITPVGMNGNSDLTISVHPIGTLGIFFTSPPSAASGAYLSQVDKGGPAANAGITAGDVITSVGGQAITSGVALHLALEMHKPGDQIQIAWTDHSGQTHSATVTLRMPK